ncbi:MAG: helix-turn-helix domain-containing protein [Bacteroidia bacterium]|nr:helix-turn-helix domain-containing protein [Bacteroidia bacterium]
MPHDSATEIRILDAARKVFYQKGFGGARMDEIAQEAGINKALLHYYFRSKQQLFEHIFNEAYDRFLPEMIRVLGSEASLEEKIRSISLYYHNLLTENPLLPIFVLKSLQENPDALALRLGADRPGNPARMVGMLMRQIGEAVEEGKYKAMDPQNLIINIIALNVFPFIIRPVLSRMMGMKDEDFITFADMRKTAVPNFILDAIKGDTPDALPPQV